ncbi:MAG: helix-turn-helix domain-containing protein [Chloroflexota bacterium]|nr:MAG: ArsR family transcriptional regulator [Chloroflexota bacterium]
MASEDFGPSREVGGSIFADLDAADERSFQLVKALASQPRLTIFRFLRLQPASIVEIATALQMPASTVAAHVRELEEAGLVFTSIKPASRGVQKVCQATTHQQLVITLPQATRVRRAASDISMPIGAYVDCDVSPTCGLATETSVIGELDNPAFFYHPDRIHAQLIWFRRGYLEYRFPNHIPAGAVVESLQFSMEIASEAPRHDNTYPSDITLWVNGVEVGTWTSPGDFGNDRGALTPDWWPDYNSQYGLLKTWKISPEGSYIDGIRISDVCLDDLALHTNRFISMRIGNKEDAIYAGGVNLFGCRFGNYPQDIIMHLSYRLMSERSEAGSQT